MPSISPRAPFRSRLRSVAASAACLASAGAASAQPWEQRSGGAEHLAPVAERRGPWLLRPDPAPELDSSGCPAGAHHLVRVGGLALRLEPRGRWTAQPVERREPVRESGLPRCGDGRATEAKMLYFDIASTARLPRDCWAVGVPPGPEGPACASTPEGLRAGRDFFALGLPGDLTIHNRPSPPAASDGEDDGLRRLTIRRRTPLGNEELRAPVPSRPDGGYPTYRLPRIGEGAAALGPLLVQCWGARWPDPIPPGRIPSPPQPCEVTFDAPRAGVRVRYRFPREVYDEPDWQTLDLRVREWIAARAASPFP